MPTARATLPTSARTVRAVELGERDQELDQLLAVGRSAGRAGRTLVLAVLARQNTLIVRTGKCPRCGSALKRNLALSGWWQCEQYGAPSFRARPAEDPCSFQCFTV